MKKVLMCVTAMAILAGAFLSVNGEEASGYAEGKKVYREKCQMCHGENGDGNGPMASVFSTPPANLTKPEFWENNPDQKIINAIENGYKLMPAIDIDPNQTKEVVRYISHTFKK